MKISRRSLGERAEEVKRRKGLENKRRGVDTRKIIGGKSKGRKEIEGGERIK